MKLERVLRCCAILALLTSARVNAEAPPQSSHEKAARELLRIMGVARTTEAGAEAMMGMVRGNPDTAPYEDVFRAWYKKTFSTGDLEGEMAQIYMRSFTEEEIRGLAAFYKTPLGQKMLDKLPIVTKEGAELGMQRAKEHTPELQEMLKKAREERAAKGSK